MTTLADLAIRWIGLRNMPKPSPNTACARRLDLTAIGGELLDARRQDFAEDEDRCVATLGALTTGDLDRQSIEEAFSRYATTQAYIGVTGKGLEESALANPARRRLTGADPDWTGS